MKACSAISRFALPVALSLLIQFGALGQESPQGGQEMAKAPTAVLNKHVVSGLEITCQGLQVKVSPGKCEVGGEPVTVSSGMPSRGAEKRDTKSHRSPRAVMMMPRQAIRARARKSGCTSLTVKSVSNTTGRSSALPSVS